MKALLFSLVLLLSIIGFTTVPSFAYAQSGSDCKTLENQLNAFGGDKGGKEAQEFLKKFPRRCSLIATLTKIMTLMLTLAGIAAVGAIIYGGFLMITSAGNEESFGKGKKTLVWAIVGLVVVLMASAIVAVVINGLKK